MIPAIQRQQFIDILLHTFVYIISVYITICIIQYFLFLLCAMDIF